MKIDFHTHGKLAKRLPFSPAYTDWLFAEAEQSGLDGLCLTEHFNTWGFEEVYGYIRERYSQDGDCFRTQSGFRIFPGMEVDIEEGGHHREYHQRPEVELELRLDQPRDLSVQGQRSFLPGLPRTSVWPYNVVRDVIL